MKYIDKFLKFLKTDRNTFATFVLTLVTAYLAVDRIVEMLLMIITGASYSYWGPITYTFALACPVFAYLFSPTSKFIKTKRHKLALFYTFTTGLYIIAVSMFAQWINQGAWLLLLSVPNYTELITEFSDLVTPAFISISLYLPLTTFYPFFNWLFFSVKGSEAHVESIMDYRGISLADTKKNTGPFTCEVYVCVDYEENNEIIMPEVSRFHSLFVCGGSGTGKTSLVFEPLMAKDIERKHFFREASKELGYTALKTKIATLNKPYDNDYLNKHFHLSMLTPVHGKESLFKAFVGKMIIDSSGGTTIYRDLGMTLVSPDYDVIDHMTAVCNNFGVEYDIVDPKNSASAGLNPFVYDNSSKIAITITSVLKAMYNVSYDDSAEAYRDDVAMQAIENVSILLKEMYPRMNEGALPNMEDLLKMLTNFELVEKMCRILAHNEELKEKYELLLAYFENCFYKGGANRESTLEYISIVISQLDNLLRMPGVKSILCNRHNNIDFDKTLAEGKFTFVCTRRGDLGAAGNKAFGLFFLISMQNAVLRRPGNENNRVPHFLYIDEFPNFISKATEPMFTMYRKYRVATTIAAQSLSQLDQHNYKNVILANCANKIFTGGAEFDEIEWWSKEFGTKRKWSYSNSMDMEKLQYDSKYGNVSWKYVDHFKPGKLQTLAQNMCAFKIRSAAGRPMVGPGKFNFLESKYKEPQDIKHFNFNKFSDNARADSDDNYNSTDKFNLKNIDFNDKKNEVNPIQTDTTGSNFLMDNQDAIVVNLKKRKKKNN